MGSKACTPRPERFIVLRKRDGMILSVSIFATGRGAATPVSCVKGCISVELPNIGQPPGDGRGGGHRGGERVRAPAGSLAAFEVPVARAGAALARGELVGVHAEAHGAARLSPLEAGVDQDAVEPLPFGLLLDQAAAGDDHGAHAGGNVLALDHASRGADVLDAA